MGKFERKDFTMTKLIEEYRRTARNLLEKRNQLQEHLLTARGEEAFLLEKRIDCLNGMYLDTCYAIREMSKSIHKEEEGIPCREANKHKAS